jgi:4-carboxymuconolactone decarboxylase
MKFHFQIARQNGLTDDEIAEVIYHASGYAGFPAAATAKNIAAKALGKYYR